MTFARGVALALGTLSLAASAKWPEGTTPFATATLAREVDGALHRRAALRR